MAEGSREPAVKEEQEPQYVVDDDVAIVSTSTPSVSVGRRRNVGGGGAAVVVVVDDGHSLPRYPTIQFAGPSTSNGNSSGNTRPAVVLCPEDVSVVLSSHPTKREADEQNVNAAAAVVVIQNHPGESSSASGGGAAAVKYAHQPQVIAKGTASSKRKRETGEFVEEILEKQRIWNLNRLVN